MNKKKRVVILGGSGVGMIAASIIDKHEDLEYIAVSSAILIYSITRKPIIVEDAGLFIKALNGFPGPFSNYVFKTIGINGILKLMNGINLRDATFKSVMVYYDGRSMLVSRGECKGFIAYCARGNKGFGFDPIFIPEGETRTFAEMEVYEKNRLSHRGKAARNLALQIREKIIKYEVKI